MRHDKEALKRLYKAIPDGEENAISLKGLADYFNMSDREMKAYINQARLNGFMICSLPSEQIGYYKPATPREALRCYRFFQKRNETSDNILHMMRLYLIRHGIDPDKTEEGENNV